MENNKPKKVVKAELIYNHGELQFRLIYNGLPIRKLKLEDDHYTLNINFKSKASRVLKGTLMIPKELITQVLQTEKIQKYGNFEINKEKDFLDIVFIQAVSIKKAKRIDDSYVFNITVRQNKQSYSNLTYILPQSMYSELVNEYKKEKLLNKSVKKKKGPNGKTCSKCFYYKSPRYCTFLSKQPARGEGRNCKHFNMFKGIKVVYNGGGFSPK
ncbi:hypothetical protein V7112_14425 [Bacillus sp. JJ1566]|uniref:hypothetical protein n=1 Tax=Bacillus sp. JJ1566 TaxID=3122961 RepID=UPI002FFFE4CD